MTPKQAKDNIKIAFGSVPKDGGTFTFYRNIRPNLEKHNITMYCVAVGKEQELLWEESYADNNCVLLASNTYNVKKQSKAFVNWCIKMDINIVMGINSEAILSAIPHLPRNIKVVSRCANSFDHGYRITMSGKERLEAIFAITPRLQFDLIEKYDANPLITHLIPNGINPYPFEEASKVKRGEQKVLQLGFLGRLEHNQKGIFHLPDLVQNLDHLNVSFHLTIAGKGADGIKLKKYLQKWVDQKRVSFVGALSPKEVPEFFKNIDLYIFPSHFEGCPNSLLEAMMSGCVPLSWNINGITDYIINEGQTGFLHKTGDSESMALNISKLDNDRKSLNNISKNAAKDVRIRFNTELAAESYATIFRQVFSKPHLAVNPLSWKKFKSDINFKQKGDPWLPRGIKKKLKKILFSRN